MLRNREWKLLLGLLAVVCCAGCAAGFLIGRAAGLLALALSLLFSVIVLTFTFWRYRKLQALSQELNAVCAGNYTIDLRHMEEGELSILQSDIYKVTLMLREQSVQLQADKLLLTQALSDISHQLKTPLTSMTVMTQLLADESLPPEKRAKFTQNIENQLIRIEWLVSSLLKLSKLDTGTVEMKQTEIAAKELVERAVQPLLIPLELREQALTIEDVSRVRLVCDVNWTREALVNILKNCIEHTPSGGSIRVTCEESPLYRQLRIQDTGEGIAREDLPYIFNRFYRGKNASADSVGIGLAMARAILLNQGGDITVTSQPGAGTQFLIKLPKRVV